MEKSKRVFLERGQSITLSTDAQGGGEQEFVIQSVSGAGRSVVCYDAVRDGVPGILREFYPAGGCSGPERLPDGQLVSEDGAFREMCDGYLAAHAAICRAAGNSRAPVLKNYTQDAEVLYGVSSRTDAATVYIWSPGVMGQSFAEYLADVRSDPAQDANIRLRDILAAVGAVTKGIGALHEAGWAHLKISPSQFTVDRKNGVSLFDVGRLSPVNGDADVRSDIYDIGAMLFQGLVILKEVPGGIYREADHPDIDRMVRHSALIKNSTAGTILVSMIAKILKKCLAGEQEEQYDSCASLHQDLEKALTLARKNTRGPKPAGKRKKAAEKSINSPEIVIQKMLYDHPLYESLKQKQTQIHVLVIGAGTYGQKFIDQCLQAGQMKGFDLRITAVSNTPEEDRESYLQFRPAISRFVNVNGAMEDSSRAYGSVRFVSLNEACRDPAPMPLKFESGSEEAENGRLVRAMVKEAADSGAAFDYVFVALGQSPLNERIAKLFEEETCCPVCYISERGKRKNRTDAASMLYPVYVNEPITPETISPLLEQMAFNADIAWNSSLNMDVKAAFDEFKKDEYRYSSSLAFALSIPYKLFSIGIVMQNPLKSFQKEQFPDAELAQDVAEAADLYAARVLAKKKDDSDAKLKFDTLVWLEHQRWVLNRVCESWTAPLDKDGNLDLDQCVAVGKAKIDARQTHACIVFSSPETPLSSPEYTDNGHEKWDDPDIDPNLDELDQMSIMLHQKFRAAAEEFKKGTPLTGDDFLNIEARISGEAESVIRAYKQYLFCLKNILNGVESYTRQYDYYVGCFTEELDHVSAEIRDYVTDRLKNIRSNFTPVIEANKYHNYKATDETLVEKIPFVLTYRFQNTLALAFEDGKLQGGRSDAVFSNVASATVLCPERILYLYNYTRDSDRILLVNKLSAVLNYLGKRKAHCRVSMAIAVTADMDADSRNDLQDKLNELREKKQADANASFEGYEIYDCRDYREASTVFLRYLQEHNADFYDDSSGIFGTRQADRDFAKQLQQSQLPYFEFNWRYKEFTEHVNCDYLQYIHDNSSIRINDMFALMNAEDTRFNLPEFAEDYTTLWDIYSSNSKNKDFEDSVGNWNKLCSLLDEHEPELTPTVTIQLKKRPEEKKTLTYVLPEYTYKTVSNIVRKLIGYGAIDDNSSVVGYTSENCRVQITVDKDYESEFDELFAQPELLLSYYGFDVIKRGESKNECVQVVHRNMKVSKLKLDDQKYALLKKLEAHHYIRRLERKEDLVSFEYAAPRIRKLLTSAGAILEVYTYYQLLNTGYFDDVACGYEFRWQYDGVRNELDIVATKGFRSIMVECKAVQKLEAGHYHKLDSISEHFGIGTTKVVIANTYRSSEAMKEVNKEQRSRGGQLAITTYSNKGQIKKIGQNLVGLMKSRGHL